MASGAEKTHRAPPAAGDRDDDEQEQAQQLQQDDENIMNEQPIEISSDSSLGDSASEAHLDSDSEISIIDDSQDDVDDDSEGDSQNEERLQDEFAMILAMPFKEHKLYMQLCHTAFKINAFENINVAISAFEKYSTIPAHIWLRYLKTLKAVTQTPEEHETYYSKCATALSSYYDENLAEFILKGVETLHPTELWTNLLCDYGIERGDFMVKVRGLLQATENKELEQALSEQCVAWNCSEQELKEMSQIIGDFKAKLKERSENSSWLQEMFLLRVDTLPVSKRCKVSLDKVIYELSLCKWASNSELWLDYIAYMQTPVDKESEKSQLNYMILNDGYLKCKPMELIRRALLAMPSIKLNHKFLQLMEQHDYPLDKVDAELGQLFARIEQYMEMTVELELDYLAYRVRHIQIDVEQQVSALRAAFRQAWNRLSEKYGELADTGYEVLQLWALVEYATLKSPNEGAAIWSEIFSYPGSSDRVDLWLACAQMDAEYNGGRKIRSLLQQALSTLPANVVGISDLYRRYERCFGNYETIAQCQAYCTEIQLSNHVSAPQRSTTFAQGRRQPVQPKTANKKHFAGGAGGGAQSPSSKKLKKDLPAHKKQPPPPPPPAAAAPPAPIKKETFETKPANFKYSTTLETNKIFVKNLHAGCTQQELTEAFQGYGHIKDVRLVFKQNQRFKGIAYIEFELPEQAQKAVDGANGLELGGLPISVAISNPPPKPMSATAAAAPKVGEKRRMPTTLIPTKLVMLEAKRRKKLDLDEATASATSSTASSADANGKANIDDEKEKEQKEVSNATTTPKSNDDFRKLFNI
ncbi:RNA-binding protein 4F [Drosophila albomicans]|uniref:RNA-binding protein 4F n=1 Tax=Drosophila albomicans TaxID=7291 RepID=A0A6P8WWE3_DROAB|nr:RNA-binding protein 4F [Drosophila albomicans]